jgi:hypothetical protein
VRQIQCKQVDLWDGGERQLFGFYIHDEVPDEIIKVRHPHCAIRPVTLTVFDSLEEVAEHDVKKLRQSAWDKLTPLERKALGLTTP